MKHSKKIIDLAYNIMQGKKYIQTEWGKKTQEGLIDMIENETAAPDLLEACKALLEMITDNRLHGDEVYRASEAVSKAEGKD